MKKQLEKVRKYVLTAWKPILMFRDTGISHKTKGLLELCTFYPTWLYTFKRRDKDRMRKKKRENKDFKNKRGGKLGQGLGGASNRGGGGVCNPLTNYINFLDRAVINKCKWQTCAPSNCNWLRFWLAFGRMLCFDQSFVLTRISVTRISKPHFDQGFQGRVG